MADTVTIGGKHFEVKPLNLKSLKELASKGYLQKLASVSTSVLDADQIEAVVGTITVTLKRAYPDITVEWVEDNLEVQDIGTVLSVILAASGFKSEGSKTVSP